jgi:2-dehydropantoate 2-reductase
MRIAIYGAGAIGAYLGAHLASAGELVTLIARGAHLEALRTNGLRLLEGGAEKAYRLPVTGDPATAGPQEYVVLALKAHQVAPALDGIGTLLGPETAVVTAQNGIPWWYFHGVEGPHSERRLQSVDPGGRIWDAIGPERAIGCVVYPACEIVMPGVIRHVEGDRFSLGEPDGTRTERVEALAKAMIRGGLKAPQRTRIRNEIWVKLWGNVAFNPISALTRATLEDICRDPATRGFARDVMLEAAAVARALGEDMPVDVEQRIQGAAQVGAHKTSMLQDLEQGREMEVEAIVGSVVELARLAGAETPNLDRLYGLVRLLAQALERHGS